jgi:hypothetical protein
MAQKIGQMPGQMSFKGARVPIGQKIVQSSNPILHGYGYRMKQQLFKGGK